MSRKRIILILTLAAVFTLGDRQVDADYFFGTPELLAPPINHGPHFSSFEGDWHPDISSDGLVLYFASERPGGRGNADLWMSARLTSEDPWGEPVNLGSPVNSSAADFSPSISADGLSLYFYSWRGSGQGKSDIWVSTRTSIENPWRTPSNLGSSVNSNEEDRDPCISADGLTLYFTSNRGGNWDIYKASRPNLQTSWSQANIESVYRLNSPEADRYPSISSDGLSIYFSSYRVGTQGFWDIYVATRSSLNSPWNDPVNLGDPINSPYYEHGPCISSDGLELYYGRGAALYVAKRQSHSEPFGQPVPFSSIESSAQLSTDGLTLHFSSSRAGGIGYADIWVAFRDSPDSQWQEPINLGTNVNSDEHDWAPSLTIDGLELYFGSGRETGYGGTDIWVSNRRSTGDPWSAAINLGSNVNSVYSDYHPAISSDGLTLIFASERSGGSGNSDLWMTQRASLSEPWDMPVNLGQTINTENYDEWPSLSADGRWLFFSKYQDSPPIYNQIMISQRTSDGHWGPPRNLALEVDLPTNALGPTISPDGCTLFFWSEVPEGLGGPDIWKMDVLPIVDLNGDGIVDEVDLCIVVDNWGSDVPSCDVGPSPLGDGVIDANDLIVVAEHLFEDVNDPTLVAHWALDEIEGTTALDSAGENIGYTVGDPVWQPDAGQVNGALEFDGIDDYISAPAVLNPEDGPFSVLLWIKGGAAGQAIISETTGKKWLSLDPLTGSLMTALTQAGRLGGPLLSQTEINDGNWHRIGLVWDGSNRALYVDGIAVAQDTQSNLLSSVSGWYIGCKDPLQPDTFFSGLIDDVRIYNRAVQP